MTNNDEILIDAIKLLMEDYEFSKDDAIDLIMELCEDDYLLEERVRERIAYELSKVPVNIHKKRLKSTENDLAYVKKLRKDLDDENPSRHVRLKKEKLRAENKLEYYKKWADEDIKRLGNKADNIRGKLAKSTERYNNKKNKYELSLRKEDTNMLYDDEELLEAIDILVEEYGFDEEEAIDLVLESYEEDDLDDEDLDELSEALDILMEDYGYDEDEALDMILESYEEELNEDFKFKKGKKTGHVGYKGGQPHDKAMIRPTFQGAWGPTVYEYDDQMGKLEPGRYSERLGKGKKGPKDKTIRTFSQTKESKTNPGRGARYNLNLFKKYPDDNMADRFGGVTTKSIKKLAKHINFKDDKKLSKIYNNHKTAVKIKTTINDNKKKIAVGAGAAIGGAAYLAHRANKKRNKKRIFRRRR